MKNTLAMLFSLASLIVLVSYSAVHWNYGTVEYRVDRVEFKYEPPNGLQDYLNTMSQDGWRLVQFAEHDTWYRVVMSRPKK